MRRVLADELGEDRPSGAVVHHRIDDVLLGRGALVHAEILGHEPVGRTLAADAGCSSSSNTFGVFVYSQ